MTAVLGKRSSSLYNVKVMLPTVNGDPCLIRRVAAIQNTLEYYKVRVFHFSGVHSFPETPKKSSRSSLDGTNKPL